VALGRYLFDHEWDIQTLRSFIGVTTSQMYQSWARSVKQEVFTDVLPEGAKLHWIGSRRDESHHKVFLFFHGESCSPCTVRIHRLICADPRVTGGGYVLPARAEYFPFLQSLQTALSAEVGEVGVAALEYCGSTIQTNGWRALTLLL
jgi:hypothetical protein